MSSTTAVDNESSPLAPVVMIGHLHLPAEVEVAGNTTTTTTTSTTAINANITTTTDGSSQDDGIGQEVVSEMVAFNAADVTEVEAFDEVDWTQQQQQQQQHHLHHHHHHHQGHHNGHSDYAEEVSAGGGGDGGGGMLSSHERDQRLQHHQDHIVDGAMIMSSGGQVMFVESGEVSTKMAGRVSFTRPAAPVVDPPSEELVEEKVFATKSAYVPHQRLEHSNVSIPTSSQPAATSAAEAPRRIHLCTLCNKVFTTSSNLQQHRRLHLNERPFKCDQCNKGFATSTNLKQHYRTHTGDRPYPCVYCSKRFATNSNLRQHIRTHTGERPHLCSYTGCGRGFNDAAKLKNHERTHTGERPFECSVCGNEFTTRNNLKAHIRSHYDPKTSVQRQSECKRRDGMRTAAEANPCKKPGPRSHDGITQLSAESSQSEVWPLSAQHGTVETLTTAAPAAITTTTATLAIATTTIPATAQAKSIIITTLGRETTTAAATTTTSFLSYTMQSPVANQGAEGRRPSRTSSSSCTTLVGPVSNRLVTSGSYCRRNHTDKSPKKGTAVLVRIRPASPVDAKDSALISTDDCRTPKPQNRLGIVHNGTGEQYGTHSRASSYHDKVEYGDDDDDDHNVVEQPAERHVSAGLLAGGSNLHKEVDKWL